MDLNAITAIRQYSRQIVRELGMLGNCHDELRLTNSQVHAMVEIERSSPLGGLELAERLGLEKSTISRLVKEMVKKKLVSVSQKEKDGRRKSLELTEHGKRKLSQVHAEANQRVHAALEKLSRAEADTVIKGLEFYAQALRASRRLGEVTLRRVQASDDLVLKRIIVQSLDEFGANRPGFAAVDPELDGMSVAYRRSRHSYVVAERAGELLGGAGVGPLEGGNNDTCELRRMFLKAEARGQGIGRLLMDKCLSEARRFRFKRCYLETLSSMRDAINLYEKYGFKRLAKPLGSTGHFGCNVWMVMDL